MCFVPHFVFHFVQLLMIDRRLQTEAANCRLDDVPDEV